MVLRLFLLLVEDMLWMVEVVVSGGGEDGEYRGVVAQFLMCWLGGGSDEGM